MQVARSPQRRPMSFEEAMQKADKSRICPDFPDRTGMPQRYDVEVYLRTPFEGVSLYRSTFTAAPPLLDSLLPPAGAPSGPGASPGGPTLPAPFYGETTNQASFPRYPIEAITAAGNVPRQPPSHEPRSPTPFYQGGSTYKTDFTPQKAPLETPSRNPAPASQSRSQQRIPFEGRSTASEHYTPPPRSAYAHAPPGAAEPQRANIPFSGRTHNQDVYVPYDLAALSIQDPRSHHGPASGHQPVRVHLEDRDFTTSNRDAFQAPQAPLVELDTAGRLRVTVDASATVGDLKAALQQSTFIPIAFQALVRKIDGAHMEQDDDAPLDSLNWRSGEELLLSIT